MRHLKGFIVNVFSKMLGFMRHSWVFECVETLEMVLVNLHLFLRNRRDPTVKQCVKIPKNGLAAQGHLQCWVCHPAEVYYSLSGPYQFKEKVPEAVFTVYPFIFRRGSGHDMDIPGVTIPVFCWRFKNEYKSDPPGSGEDGNGMLAKCCLCRPESSADWKPPVSTSGVLHLKHTNLHAPETRNVNKHRWKG